ncbi:MAG: PTS sugar transporter subunit IIA [Asticcacaulis sp.]
MIGLVIVTHGRLAEEFVAAMEHVVGPQSQLTAICIGPEDDVAQRRQDILNAAVANNSGEGVILLTDMFGGTPSNLAISVMEQTHAEVIAGLNLPMLIKLASLRKNEDLNLCVGHAQEAGRKYVTVASYVLSGDN